MMEKVAIVDLSLYGKMEIRGPDATAFLNYVFCCRPPEVSFSGSFCVVP